MLHCEPWYCVRQLSWYEFILFWISACSCKTRSLLFMVLVQHWSYLNSPRSLNEKSSPLFTLRFAVYRILSPGHHWVDSVWKLFFFFFFPNGFEISAESNQKPFISRLVCLPFLSNCKFTFKTKVLIAFEPKLQREESLRQAYKSGSTSHSKAINKWAIKMQSWGEFKWSK